MQNFSDFFNECDRGPRLNQLAGFFSDTAAGKNGMPVRKPVVDKRMVSSD